MTRGPSALAMIGVLGLGIGLGLALGRAPMILSARPGAPGDGDNREDVPATGRAASESALDDDQERQYARFESIDRTFTLVARAVSPAVVHIVARKPGAGGGRVSTSQVYEE